MQPSTRRMWHIFEVLGEFRDVDAFLPSQTAQCFVYIAMHDPCPMKDLAEALGVAQTTVSRNVLALTERDRYRKPGLDLVESYADPMNLRRKLIKLKPKGRRLANRLNKVIEDYESRTTKRYPQERQ